MKTAAITGQYCIRTGLVNSGPKFTKDFCPHLLFITASLFGLSPEFVKINKMKALVVYDSLYGNTEKVARAIADAVGGEAKSVGKLDLSELKDLDLLIASSPTHGGRPSPSMQEFLNRIPNNALQGVKVAAFDTRFEKSEHGIGLRLLMTVINFAAPRIAKALESKGGKLVAEPEGFIVSGKEGPLKKGELERAKKWGGDVINKTVG